MEKDNTGWIMICESDEVKFAVVGMSDEDEGCLGSNPHKVIVRII